MSDSPPSLAAEIEAIRRAYAALNRGDVPGFVSLFDPQIERVEFEGTPMGGTYRGLAAVTEHVAKARATWAEGACEPRRFITPGAGIPGGGVPGGRGDRVVVLVDVRVRLKHETAWREGRVADGFAFRNGKAIEFRSFSDERQALAWAGLPAPDAPEPTD